MLRSRFIYILRILISLTDFVLVNVGFLLIHTLEFGWSKPILSTHYQDYLIIVNLAFIISAAFTGLYSEKSVENVVTLYRASFRFFLLHSFIFLLYLVFTGNADVISRLFVGGYYLFMMFGLIISRFFSTIMEQRLVKLLKENNPIALLGRNATGLRLATYLEKQNGVKFAGFLDTDNFEHLDDENHFQIASDHLHAAATKGITDVLISLKPNQMSQAQRLVAEADKLCLRLRFVPDMDGIIAAPFTVRYVDEFPMISLRDAPLDNIHPRFKKRLFDIVFASIVIVTVLSWLVPILAIIIKLQSRGPVFFTQLRTGRDNKAFRCFKFRSMRVNNDADKLQATAHDKRLTPIGAFMRKTNLDELPQFFNVLIGNMSVIGPRPHMLKHTEEYRKIIDEYMVRQFLKPGVSGWAQVNGYRGETTDSRLMKKRVEYDITYMKNWSLMLDVKIIFLTVINMIKGEEQAY